MMNLALQSNSADTVLADTPVNLLPQGYHFRRFTGEEYDDMARAGIMTEDDAVELLEGWLVHKMIKNLPHTATTRYTRAALKKCLPPGYFVDSQARANSEPDPDRFIVRGTVDDYTRTHSHAQEIVWVVEVTDASLDFVPVVIDEKSIGLIKVADRLP